MVGVHKAVVDSVRWRGGEKGGDGCGGEGRDGGGSECGNDLGEVVL